MPIEGAEVASDPTSSSAEGSPIKQNIGLQAQLKAEASTTFGVDIDKGYSGFVNSAKATIILKFIDHGGFSWGTGQKSGDPSTKGKGIRGAIAVEDFKLSNGDGKALGTQDYFYQKAYFRPAQVKEAGGQSPYPDDQWLVVPEDIAPGSPTWEDCKGIYNNGKPFTFRVEWRDTKIGSNSFTSPKDQTFTVTYGDIAAYLYLNEFYIKVSTKPTIKADNTTRYWSSPVNRVADSYYGHADGLFFGCDNFIGREYANAMGGISLGYQKDKVFNINGELASMSHFDRNSKNVTGAFGQAKWLSTPVGGDSAHGSKPLTEDGRPDLLNTKGSNGAFTAGAKLSYLMPFSNFGIENGHRMEFILGLDSMIDPYASEKSLYGGKDKNKPAQLLTNQGLNSSIAIGGAIRYQWPVKEDKYCIGSGDAANHAFYYDDGNDRHSGLTFGIAYERALGFKRHDKKANTMGFDQFYQDGANALNLSLTFYEAEEHGIVPGLGLVFGIEANDILKKGKKQLTGEKTLAFNMASQVQLSYAFKGTWLSPRGRIIPYLGAWFSPNSNATLSEEVFSAPPRLYTKLGLLFKQVIPFTEIGIKWQSNNWLSRKDIFGSVSTTLKIVYK
ncbi:UNVERIFIED_CONTAM: hypothetical protein PYX00_011219 [Menopon gallinae]|uniref:Uncharacterized protein n=1 Tax=Menopon gallinae TaxID=328185 RepID=A0AAW2H6M3_9NEOP